MRVDIAWWELEGSATTIDSLELQLQDGGTAEWSQVPGLTLKLWIGDRCCNRWGAVMIWDPERPAAAELPPNRAAELIGRPADCRIGFDVAAVAEGVSGCAIT